jgi:hypothetical protein
MTTDLGIPFAHHTGATRGDASHDEAQLGQPYKVLVRGGKVK